MEIHNKYCVYVATARGALLSSECKACDTANYLIKSESSSSEITALEWGRNEDEILIGNKNGELILYSTLQNKCSQRVTNLEGQGSIVGVGHIENCILAAKQNGHITIMDGESKSIFCLNMENNATLCHMLQNVNKKNIIATGGERSDLKLWDVERKSCLFKAKSLGHDELNLPLPTSIRGITFIADEHNLVGCVTKEGYVLLYDDRSQRKPIVKYVEPKASYTAITYSYRERKCIVGTSRGYMQLVDLRTPVKCLKTFKSFTGSVTSIVCDPQSSIIASSSLDRYLRLHDIDSKELLYKEYMKQNLTKILLKPILKEEPLLEETAPKDTDEEYEQIFDNMESVTDVSIKKHKRKLNTTTRSKKLKSV